MMKNVDKSIYSKRLSYSEEFQDKKNKNDINDTLWAKKRFLC